MIKIGIVGCGRILPAHLNAFRILREAGVANFRVTALCARKLDDARMFAKRGEGPSQRRAVSTIPGDPLAIDDQYVSDFQDDVAVEVYDDYQQMIAEADINAIHDYATHGVHHLVAHAAIERGCDLLTQKPLAVTMELACKMVESAQAAGIVFGVFENWRFRPDLRRLKWLVDSGRLGRLQMMLMGNIASWWAPDLVVAETPWRHDAKVGGGISLDMGVHQFHFIRHLAGEIKDLHARTAVLEPQRHILRGNGRPQETIQCDADDTYFATFTSESGMLGNISASWGGHGEATVIGGGPVLYGTAGRVAGNQVTFDGQTPRCLDEMYDTEASADRKEREFPMGITDTLALLTLDWLRAIEEGRQPEANAAEGLKDLACAFGIVESAHRNQPVEIADVLSGEIAEYQQQIARNFGVGR